MPNIPNTRRHHFGPHKAYTEPNKPISSSHKAYLEPYSTYICNYKARPCQLDNTVSTIRPIQSETYPCAELALNCSVIIIYNYMSFLHVHIFEYSKTNIFHVSTVLQTYAFSLQMSTHLDLQDVLTKLNLKYLSKIK